ncbi:unnamed protein product [Paramecium sonneborni]|uniref:Uncharacterized protein n=1 Tax=Paramecium sonneborni TaxID=65129 RepID=A0A8S1MDS3_9CILI|nr:unnamed protein product [Paramecium sonneborni]
MKLSTIQQSEASMICINQEVLQKSTEQVGLLWDYYWNRFVTIKFYITFTNKKEIKITTTDGFILRVDSQENISNLIHNLEQIKHLQWLEQSKPSLNKVGKWTLIWKGLIVKNVGGDYINGIKQGQWKEPIQNYWTLAQVYEMGEYENGQKRGKWQYIYEDQEIGGGQYDNQYQKNGRWIELSQNFMRYCQVIYDGEYKNDKKINKWDFKHRFSNIYPFEQIGGGSYNQEGSKIGQWIELINNFYGQRQVTFNGEYDNCQKVGKWDTYFRSDGLFSCQFNLIGGGSYDNQGLKNGKWVDLSNNFYKYSQVTYEGNYKNGIKIDKWIINYKSDNLEQIGGGFYDLQGNKYGIWIELSEDFRLDSQIIYKGEYDKGNKVGKWNIMFRQIDVFEQIGGGNYNEYNTKIGKWTELSESFYSGSKIIYQGEYYIGNKIGLWNILWKDEMKIFNIGGGLYDNGQKYGSWNESTNYFKQDCLVTYHGQYKNRQKIGKWYIKFNINNQSENIGGGSYDQEGIQNGYWEELREDFRNSNQVKYIGKYQNGKKVGIWEEIKRNQSYMNQGFQNVGQLIYPNEQVENKE